VWLLSCFNLVNKIWLLDFFFERRGDSSSLDYFITLFAKAQEHRCPWLELVVLFNLLLEGTKKWTFKFQRVASIFLFLFYGKEQSKTCTINVFDKFFLHTQQPTFTPIKYSIILIGFVYSKKETIFQVIYLCTCCI